MPERAIADATKPDARASSRKFCTVSRSWVLPFRTMIDFDRLSATNEVIVQVCETNVENARRRVFSNEDISIDAVMASATLPDLFPAVEIDGEHYWDGGFS